MCFFQIHLKDGNYRMADQSLEVGLSYNFQVGLYFPYFVMLIYQHLLYVLYMFEASHNTKELKQTVTQGTKIYQCQKCKMTCKMLNVTLKLY